jgi:hypothetical protein
MPCCLTVYVMEVRPYGDIWRNPQFTAKITRHRAKWGNNHAAVWRGNFADGPAPENTHRHPRVQGVPWRLATAETVCARAFSASNSRPAFRRRLLSIGYDAVKSAFDKVSENLAQPAQEPAAGPR